jgi:DNA-binding protein HU-beta
MRSISSRISVMSGEGALSVFARAKELEGQGRSIIHLELGEPDFHPGPSVIESAQKALAAGNRIELRGFGVFNVRPRKTGIGRNPRTGAEVSIPPGRAVRFKPGKELQSID